MKMKDYNRWLSIDCKYGRIKFMHVFHNLKTLIFYKNCYFYEEPLGTFINIEKIEFAVFSICENYKKDLLKDYQEIQKQKQLKG